MMAKTFPTKPLADMIQRHRADYELLGKVANRYLDTKTGVQLEALLKLIGARRGCDWVLREYGRSRGIQVNILNDETGTKFAFFFTKEKPNETNEE